MVITFYFLVVDDHRCFLSYVSYSRDGLTDMLVGGRIIVQIRYLLATVSLIEASFICIIYCCTWVILDFPMWCKPSLDDIWFSLYLEISWLTVYPTWCVPSTNDVWIFWLSFGSLINGFVWSVMEAWKSCCNMVIFAGMILGWSFL